MEWSGDPKEASKTFSTPTRQNRGLFRNSATQDMDLQASLSETAGTKLQQLFGDGVMLPGGTEEALRLVRPFKLSGQTTLLLLGAGRGGEAQAIASAFDTWIEAFESDPAMRAEAATRVLHANLAKRVRVRPWNPAAPTFRRDMCAHGLSLLSFRGCPCEPILSALAVAIRPMGQLALLELVAEPGFDPNESSAAAWLRLERMGTALPSADTITELLSAYGFDVRVVEDTTERHRHFVLSAWQAFIKPCQESRSLSPRLAAEIVNEAERWLLRLRLMQQKKIRLVRWHAIQKH